MSRLYAVILSILSFSISAQAQEIGTLLRDMDQSTASRIIHGVVGIGLLSLIPGILIVATSFTRIIIVLSILRTSLGLQSTPNNLVIISLAFFMTLHVMSPTFDTINEKAVIPYSKSEIKEQEAISRVVSALREFMKQHVREKDLLLFVELSGHKNRKKMDDDDMRVVAPAFMTSELRRGFEIGFLIAIPFLLIDIIVATIVMSMGMMMLPPSVISLPIKIMFFVLIDGWNLVVGTLARSFG